MWSDELDAPRFRLMNAQEILNRLSRLGWLQNGIIQITHLPQLWKRQRKASNANTKLETTNKPCGASPLERPVRHCLEWMRARGYPQPPRSACYFCPYKSNAEWRKLRDEEPEEWARAVEIDGLIRAGVRDTTQKLYLHRSLTPLADIDLSTAEDRGQLSVGFGEECEGMCGV